MSLPANVFSILQCLGHLFALSFGELNGHYSGHDGQCAQHDQGERNPISIQQQDQRAEDVGQEGTHAADSKH